MLLAIEPGAVKGGSGFLPSRRVLGRASKAGVVEVDSGSVGTSRAGQVWIHSVPSEVRSGFVLRPPGRPGPSSLHAL